MPGMKTLRLARDGYGPQKSMIKKSAHLYDQEQKTDPYFREYSDAVARLSTEWRQATLDLKELAYRGSMMSMLYIADVKMRGWKIPQDLPGAESWFEAACKSGSLRGRCGLALTHLLMGKFSRAIDELEEVVADGYPPAMNSLAGIYFRGDGVDVDKKKAYALWRRGASLGHFHSSRHLFQQSIRGQFGAAAFIRAPLVFLSAFFKVFPALASNSHSDRMR